MLLSVHPLLYARLVSYTFSFFNIGTCIAVITLTSDHNDANYNLLK